MTTPGPASTPDHQRGSSEEIANPDGDSSFGALLVTSNFGPEPQLRSFNKVQNDIRTLLLRCSDYECSQFMESDSIVPDDWYGVVDYYSIGEDDWTLEGITDLVDPRRPDLVERLYPPILVHVAGAAVNPWLEIIAAAGGTAALARAGWKALVHANEIFDFFVRVRNWRFENEARVSRLKELAVRDRCETVVTIIDQLDGSARGVAAAHLLSMALGLSEESLDSVRMEQISSDEAETRRSHIERMVSSEILNRPETTLRDVPTSLRRANPSELDSGGPNGELTRGSD
ncbi:hypothetical protein OG203_24640 [Nocardia sp. NBC_01499]|uniref:hypothetical protein n=1 Tax=Nocardia sp. NBC_01499 TaxID=2903597 RepID=UPI00386D30BE